MPQDRQILRFVPDRPFPAYSYVPGRFPHPLSDPQGHSFGTKPQRFHPPDPERWHLCQPYRYGIDLFNHGYYWEAHEVWEGLWHACGRSGPTAQFLKGLIHLAAAGVKVRQGIPQGVKSHARRAAELFRQTAETAGRDNVCYLGLPLDQLIRYAQEVAVAPIPGAATEGSTVTPVFDFVLAPA